MANLFVCTNYFVSSVSQDDSVVTFVGGLLDSDGHNTEDFSYNFVNNDLYDMRGDGVISDAALLKYGSNLSDGTYSNIPQESTTGSGSGIKVTITADNSQSPSYSCTITDAGSGYAVGDYIYFSNTAIGQDTSTERVKLEVLGTDGLNPNLFPTGLSDADVLANALPLFNVMIQHNIA